MHREGPEEGETQRRRPDGGGDRCRLVAIISAHPSALLRLEFGEHLVERGQVATAFDGVALPFARLLLAVQHLLTTRPLRVTTTKRRLLALQFVHAGQR